MHEKLIAAIDFGTSKIVLMVGKKNALGLLSVVAVETIDSSTCVRRGCISNLDEAAAKVKTLVDSVNKKIHPKIDKVYVGLGGQSVCSQEHTISRKLLPESIVNKTLLDSIAEECLNYEPDLSALLDAIYPEYYLDGRVEQNPQGVQCTEIEAKYQLITGRPSIKRDITKILHEKVGVTIAGYIVSSEATAAAVLAPAEKDLGCALVDIGAGITTLSIYKGKLLKYMVTIPLGSDLITKDLCSLGILREEAEAFKKEHGQAIAGDEDENRKEELFTSKNVDSLQLNRIIEARMDEILANVIAQIEQSGQEKSLASGIIVTGGGANLKKFLESLKDKINCDIRVAFTQKAVLAEETEITRNTAYTCATGMLVLGEKSCEKEIPVPQEPVRVNLFDDMDFGETKIPLSETRKPKEPEVKKPAEKKEKPEGRGLFRRIGKGIDGISKSLFDDTEE